MPPYIYMTFFKFEKGGAPWKWPLFSVEKKVRVHAGVAWPKKVGKLSIWISAFKIRPRRAAGGPPREVTGPRHGQVRVETHFGEFWPVMWFYAASWRTCGKYNLLNLHICLSEACFCMLVSPCPDSQPFLACHTVEWSRVQIYSKKTSFSCILTKKWLFLKAKKDRFFRLQTMGGHTLTIWVSEETSKMPDFERPIPKIPAPNFFLAGHNFFWSGQNFNLALECRRAPPLLKLTKRHIYIEVFF